MSENNLNQIVEQLADELPPRVDLRKLSDEIDELVKEHTLDDDAMREVYEEDLWRIFASDVQCAEIENSFIEELAAEALSERCRLKMEDTDYRYGFHGWVDNSEDWHETTMFDGYLHIEEFCVDVERVIERHCLEADPETEAHHYIDDVRINEMIV